MTTEKQERLSIMRRLGAAVGRLSGEWKAHIEPRIAPERMATEMTAASLPTMSFFVLLALSSSIATFGLLQNSAPAIIGAMIIAPLMTPIMGLSFGLVQLSWSQIARSGITVLLGVAVVIAIGYVSTRIIGIRIAGSEMLNRAFPSLLDLGVAVAAGAAGAFVLSRESIRNSVAGVAIAVALVPPLAVVGIGLALDQRAVADVGLSFHDVGLFSRGTDLALGALVLFLTNLAAIVVVAGAVMVIQGYARWKTGIIGLLSGFVALGVVMHPLSEEFHKLSVKSVALRLVQTLNLRHPEIGGSPLRVETLRLRYEDDVLYLHAEGALPRDALAAYPTRLKWLRQELEKRLGERIILEVDAVPVDLVQFRAAPSDDEGHDARFNPTTGD